MIGKYNYDQLYTTSVLGVKTGEYSYQISGRQNTDICADMNVGSKATLL